MSCCVFVSWVVVGERGLGEHTPGLDILIGEFYEIELLFDLQVGCRELRRCEICVEGAIVVM